MTAAAQQHMWEPPAEPDDSNDTYCTPPEVAEPIKKAAGGVVHMDPWTNAYAIAHGWINALTAWTIDDGRKPGVYVAAHDGLDMTEDPRPWPITAGEYVHGNPPYSDPKPFVSRFVYEIEQAGAWGMLLLKSDNRTRWAKWLLDRGQPIVIWKGPINFFKNGARVTGNNFPSTLYVVDATDTTSRKRAGQLKRAFGDKAWVYR